MSTDTAENLFHHLRLLLEKQIERVKKNDFRGVEALAEQADALVADIVKIQPPQRSLLKDRYEQLAALYQQLELMIAAEKDSARRQLRKIGNGKKTIHAYHGKRQV